MRAYRNIILISSVLLLTFSSGLLFYKNLFSFESPKVSSDIDFEDIRFIDLQVNATSVYLRNNLSNNPLQINAEINRIRELQNIASDINKESSELSQSFKRINNYFNLKIKNLEAFQASLKLLKDSLDKLIPSYNELSKNNIKFSVDKKDFYQETLIHTLFYSTNPSKENEERVQEDKKILSQIINFSSKPNPLIINFSRNIETIHIKTKNINLLIENFNNDNSIKNDLSIIGKYYRNQKDARAHDGEIFLTIVFCSLVFYLMCVVMIIRRLT